ncbi:MAG TPA: thioredoxin [Candidatus Pullichristensenella stercorigallinarum]|uniref:Thioredoxin n=1 Tax=Candidatus Pullichristensenella stercorigallinarum TaxID=2840909 RepID=A0A9D0ZNE7_9FIRM|nr:thioredoxin [Candidatus Pullichristensenella stercorigallinarum]
MSEQILNLKGSDLTETKLASLGKVLVDFWAPWCGPCRMVAPILEQVAAEMSGKVTIAKVNIDDNPDAAAQYGVSSIPTMILFVDGKEAARMIGANPKGAIVDFINSQN